MTAKTPQLGQETLILFLGRITNMVVSVVGVIVYPRFLGPYANGTYQYYLGLLAFMLGFLNGCASPMATHFVALYRVSEPRRERVLLAQLTRWFLVMVLTVWFVYPALRNKMGFWPIYAATIMAGYSQLLASVQYGRGRLAPTTWFPVLNLVLRIAFVGVGGVLIADEAARRVWSEDWIPTLFLIAALPSLVWMAISYQRSNRTLPEAQLHPAGAVGWFPLEEIKRFGLGAMIGQLIYQLFTRTLVPLAEQLGYAREEVGYLGLALQIFSIIIYLAGIFSVSIYPWLISAAESREQERFARIQAQGWRFSCLIGGLLAAGLWCLAPGVVWVVLGPEYHADQGLIVNLFRITTLAGGFMVAAEFHLRVIFSRTETKRYVYALLLGFAPAVPFAAWASTRQVPVEVFALILPLGVGGAMVVATWLAPVTHGLWRYGLGALVAVLLPAWLLRNYALQTLPELLLAGVAVTLLYLVVAALTGLISKSDFLRLQSAIRDRL